LLVCDILIQTTKTKFLEEVAGRAHQKWPA